MENNLEEITIPEEQNLVTEDQAFASIGEAYYRGFGFKRDFQQAFRFYQKAASLGNNAALCKLGFCYERGHGTQRDPEAALTCFETASDRGDALATLRIGDYYRDGLRPLITRDRRKATSYYLAALQQAKFSFDVWNAPDIYMRVADSLYHGIGIDRDVENAYSFYNAAAELYLQRIDSGDSESEPLLEEAEIGANACGKELGYETEVCEECFEA